MGKHTKIRTRSGNHTPTGEWSRLCDFETADGTGWAIYSRQNGERYSGIKIAVFGEIVGKANYWMTWDGFERNLFRQDAAELRKYRFEVFKLASDYLKLFA